MSQERFTILIAKKLHHEASEAELADLQQLLAENPEWQTTASNLEELWKQNPEPARPDAVVEESYLLHLSRLKDRVSDFEYQAHEDDYPMADVFPIDQPRKWYTRWQLYAALLVVALGIFLLKFAGGAKTPATDRVAGVQDHENEINVKPGTRSRMQLPDGTQVWINSGSKLTYSGIMDGNTREVNLDGEAFFDVVKDPARPFIVHTSGIDIRVLGTAFNVKAYNAEPTIEALLVHGSIEVVKTNQPNGPKLVLKPHEKLVYDKTLPANAAAAAAPADVVSTNTPAAAPAPVVTITSLPKAVADSAFTETSWVYNRLSFEEEKLEDVALKMERWFNVKIAITNDKLKNKRISGSFEKETIDEALQYLRYVISFQYSIKGKDVTISKK